MLCLKEWKRLGAAHTDKSATRLVDGPAHATLQATRAICDLVQCRPQLVAFLAAVRCCETFPCRPAPYVGCESVEMCTIAIA
ncbi:hypothetical protein Q094_00530 [Pseudomonas aeruginosa PS42]|nr:hypothetical protein Q094_00530 [Pseudomonas aeruginosa PS42]